MSSPPAPIESLAHALSGEQAPIILVVDDEPLILEVLSRYFSMSGLVPLTAVGGGEAIDVFSSRHQEICLVLIDVRMPELNGPETLAVLRQIDPNVRCCFMTGDLGEISEAQIQEAGVLEVFRKPFALRDIVSRVWELARQKP